MDDLINRDDVIESIVKLPNVGVHPYVSLESVLDILLDAPCIDTDLSRYSDKLWKNGYERGKKDTQQEITRCENCKYYQDNNDGYPHPDCKWNKNETPDEDDFCSGAERKTIEAEDKI